MKVHHRNGKKREETIGAMVAAAEKLFSERSFAAVTVRETAEEAGVSGALVHRYLGPKEEILHAAFEHHENSMRDGSAGAEDLSSALALMLREGLDNHPHYLRLVVQLPIQDAPFEETMGRLPAGVHLASMAEQVAGAGSGETSSGVTPRFAIAALLALDLGWIASGDWLMPAMGLEDIDEESLA